MNCRHVRSLLSAYIDSELTGYEMLEIRDHLAGCAPCGQERESLDRVRFTLRALPQISARSEWAADLSEHIIYHTLPLSERIRIWFAREIPDTNLFARRLASAAMLTVIGVFLAASAIEPTTPQDQESMTASNTSFVPMPTYRGLYAPIHYTSSSTIGPDIQFIDPRMHPAYLPVHQTLLTPIVALRPQSGYNNLSLISLPRSGNQLLSSR